MKKSLEQIKTSKDMIRYAEHHGGQVVRQTGSHAIVQGPSGGICPVPMHNGDLATGTCRSIKKMFLAIGLAVFAGWCMFYPAIVEAAHKVIK
jgi:predicted RNA binding protein YcfA (HicA-like mRNA interferase family)